MNESGLSSDAFKVLCSATVISKAMANLMVLECHLWLNPTEIIDEDKVTFHDSPVSPMELFAHAIDEYAEHFTAAQKSLQAMCHFLPKCSSLAAVSSYQKAPSSQQVVKPALPPAQPQPKTKPEL